jgi:hypothetical protein
LDQKKKRRFAFGGLWDKQKRVGFVSVDFVAGKSRISVPLDNVYKIITLAINVRDLLCGIAGTVIGISLVCIVHFAWNFHTCPQSPILTVPLV